MHDDCFSVRMLLGSLCKQMFEIGGNWPHAPRTAQKGIAMKLLMSGVQYCALNWITA